MHSSTTLACICVQFLQPNIQLHDSEHGHALQLPDPTYGQQKT